MKKFFVALGVVSLIASVLTGCASNSKIVANTSLNIGQNSPATNLNAGALAVGDSLLSNQYISTLTQSGFYESSHSGDMVANTLFGYEKLVSSAADNFKTSYTVNKDVTWSDGTPIDGVDLLLTWAAAVNLADAGFTSSLANTGLAAATSAKLGLNDRRLYLQFSKPVADWQYAAQLTVPAHLIATAAFGSQTDAASAKKKIASAILTKDQSSLLKIAAAYNSFYSLTDSDYDVANVATSGAYTVSKANSSLVVLKARTDCKWCKAATVETVNLKFYNDASELLSAIKAGDVDLAESVDSAKLSLAEIVSEMDSLKSQGYGYSTLQSGYLEALIVNFGGKSIFRPKSKVLTSEQKAKLVQAVLSLVPRQKIVDALGVPIRLVRADSFTFLSTQSQYQAAIQSNGSSAFAFENAENADELITGYPLNGRGPIRILFDATDLNGQTMFNMIYQYSADTSIRITNGSDIDVASILKSGQYEAYLTKVAALSVSNNAIGLVQNSSSSPKSSDLDVLIAKLANNPNSSDRNETLAAIDAELFKNGYGIPLYELPKIVIFSGKLKNYATPGGTSNAVSNFDLWSVAPDQN